MTEAVASDSNSTPEGPGWLRLVCYIVLFLLGYFAAWLFMVHLEAADDLADVRALFRLWVAVLAGISGLAAVVAATSVACLARLHRHATVPRGRRFAGVLILAFLGVGLLHVGVFVGLAFVGSSAGGSVDEDLARGTWPVTVAVGLCVSPALVAFLLVRDVARRSENWSGDPKRQLEGILRLRQELRGLLFMLGTLLTMLVVATGLRRRALVAHEAATAPPLEAVLLYGLVFAVDLGLFYWLAASSIDVRTYHLADQAAALPDPEGDDFKDDMERRAVLLDAAGASTTARHSFETTVVIAAPLITAVIDSATSA